MAPSKITVTSNRGTDTAPPGGSPGRAILSDHQWISLAEALQLSGRELEIVQCIFDDKTELAIALELGISAHTVHTHLERLYRKLGVSTRSSAVICVLAEHFSRHPSDGVVRGGRDGTVETER